MRGFRFCLGVLAGAFFLCGGHLCSNRAAESPSSRRESLAGVVAAPRPLPGVGRWQLAHKKPHGRVVALAWNHDATRIAFSDQNYVRICNVKTFETEAILVGHAKPVTGIDWNQATHRLASSSCDGSVRIWSDKGLPKKLLTGRAGEVNGVAWSKDGTKLASASADGTVQIWNADGSVGPLIKVSDATVRCVAWSPDGRRLVTGDGDYLVKIWNADGTAGTVCKGHLGEVTAVAWSPDGRQFATSTYGYKEPTTEKVFADIRIWKADGSAVSTIPDASTNCGLCWNPDGKSLAVLDISENRKGLRMYDLQGAVVQAFRVRPAVLYLPMGVSWSPDGKDIAVGGFEGLTVFHIADGMRRTSEPNFRNKLSPRPAPLVTFSPNADKCFFRFSDNGSYQVWSLDGRPGPKMPDRQLSKSQSSKPPISKQIWSPAGDQVAFVDGDKELRVWRVGSASPRPVAQAKSPIELIAWSPRNDVLAVLEQSGTFRLVRTDGVEVLQQQVEPPVVDAEPGSGVSDSVARLVFRPDGKAVAVVGLNAVEVIPTDGTPVKKLPFENPVPGGEGNGFWWSADGRQLTSLRKQQKEASQLVTWDLASGKQSKITGFVDEIASFDCSPDGSQFLIGCDTGIWQLLALDKPNSTPVEALGHVSAVRSAAFSPDGRRFATGGWDGLIKIWASDGTLEQTLFGNVWPIHGLKWSTDGKRLISLERDRTQRVYSLETGRTELTLESVGDDVLLMTADGRNFGCTPAQLNEMFVALLEQPSGGMEILGYTDFLKRTGPSHR